MSESAGLERGYRRLLAAYPQSFQREQGEEILAVLMAGARDRRRPSLAEAADVLRSGLGMRLRRALSVPDQRWADALRVVSAAAPLLVVLTGLLEVAVPYPLPPANRDPMLFSLSRFRLPVLREIGGLWLLHQPGFDIAVGGQVIIAVVVLLGRRRLGLAVVAAAAAAFWIAPGRYGIPEPMWVLGAAALPLEAVVLIAAPGGRRVRWVQRWREGIVLLLAAVAVQLLTLLSDATSRVAQTGVLLRATAHSSYWKNLPPPGIEGYVTAILVLAAAAAGLALTFKIGRYLLLLVVLCYPIVAELVAASVREDVELMGLPTYRHLSVLYLPPLVLLAGIIIVACTGLRLRLVRQSGSA
jgi:hypothetical protein